MQDAVRYKQDQELNVCPPGLPATRNTHQMQSHINLLAEQQDEFIPPLCWWGGRGTAFLLMCTDKDFRSVFSTLFLSFRYFLPTCVKHCTSSVHPAVTLKKKCSRNEQNKTRVQWNWNRLCFFFLTVVVTVYSTSMRTGNCKSFRPNETGWNGPMHE